MILSKQEKEAVKMGLPVFTVRTTDSHSTGLIITLSYNTVMKMTSSSSCSLSCYSIIRWLEVMLQLPRQPTHSRKKKSLKGDNWLKLCAHYKFCRVLN